MHEVYEWPFKQVRSFYFSQGVVWGIAYEVASQDVKQVTEYLDFREKDGYKTTSVTFYPKDSTKEAFQVMLYVATPSNESYLGPSSLPEITKQILASEGPSGKNSEYLFNLASAIREIDPECSDEHLFQLEALAKDYIKNN